VGLLAGCATTGADPHSLPSMSRTMSEADSKALLAPLGVPFADERLVGDAAAAAEAARAVGLPVAVKLCGERIAHKTERGLVRLGLADPEAVAAAAQELFDAARPEDEVTGVLVAPMVSGSRELIAGVSHDEQFGPTVLVGIGGVLTEALADVAIRLVPITEVDAEDMLDQLSAQALLDAFRGEPAVDRAAVVQVLLALSAAAGAQVGDGEQVVAVDLNPLIISDGRPIAVDALVEVAAAGEVSA
jgi:acetate---CoA ligase (ADP-forming) subunit beta